MAQMIPETIPNRASQGEKLLFSVLQEGLPDAYIVWYEPTINRLLPDFIILGPAFGLLILEVKGWYAGNVELAVTISFKSAGKEGMVQPRFRQGDTLSQE